MLENLLHQVLLAVVVSTGALAQAVAASPGAPLCPEGREPRVDTNAVTVVINAGSAWNRRVYSDDDRRRILFYADAIRQRFVTPATLGTVPLLFESGQQAWGGATSMHSAVGGKLVLVVKSNGRLREAFWQVLPLSRSFSAAVYMAAIAADTLHDFDGIPGPEGSRGDDTLVVQLRSVPYEPESGELPLMRASLMRYIAESPVRLLKRGPLYYPTNAGESGVGNEGEMQVIIGSDGRAVMAASQITRLDWRDFVNSMRGAISKSIYQPAMSNGCAVPAVSIERFTFTVDKK